MNDNRSYTGSASSGVDRLEGSAAYIDRLRKMDIPRAHLKMQITQIITTCPG